MTDVTNEIRELQPTELGEVAGALPIALIAAAGLFSGGGLTATGIWLYEAFN